MCSKKNLLQIAGGMTETGPSEAHSMAHWLSSPQKSWGPVEGENNAISNAAIVKKRV
jgi:hypothetical protein